MKALVFGAAAALLGSVAVGVTPAAAQQDVKEAITAGGLERMLREAGLNPTMMTDKATGAPVATGQTDGMIFVIRALECSGLPTACGQLVMFANFDLGRGVTEADYRVVNGFNDSNVHGRAYVLEDKRQIGVDLIIDMTGGVTMDHVGSRMGRWPQVIEEFRNQMIGARNGS